MKNERAKQQESDYRWSYLNLQGGRVLAWAGRVRLEQLTTFSKAELGKPHGMGPKALEQLRRALELNGLSFADGTEEAGVL